MSRLFESIKKKIIVHLISQSLPFFMKIVVNPIISLYAQINDKIDALTFE